MMQICVLIRIDAMGVVEDAIHYDVREELMESFRAFISNVLIADNVEDPGKVVFVHGPAGDETHVGYILGFRGDFRKAFDPKGRAEDVSGNEELMAELRATAERIAAAGYFGVQTIADLMKVDEKIQAKLDKGWQPT